MRSDFKIILDVWREACRHIEISQSVGIVAQRLAERLPLARLIVRQIDLEHLYVDTVAVGGKAAPDSTLVSGRTTCTPEQLRGLTAWVSDGTILRPDEPRWNKERSLLLPGNIEDDYLIGALNVPEGSCAGALIIRATAKHRFQASDLKLFQALREPFAAALENNHRLHEMAALREAAEAESRALLTRLGRKRLQDVIVGAESGLRPVMERVDVVCASDVPVLLLGETGTGKEVIARTIHNRSPRHEKPFIRVNCGAMPTELVDSQLFGHERGSFTGAVDTHKGWFERADTGTLFLDEIGELSAAVQVRLLRVLQDGYIERVGGKHSIHVDVRIIAATHRDLARMVKQRTFREDLWYRLAVFPIPISPLRERPEDVPALACHFAERAATRFGLALVMPTPDDLRLLRRYSWPGNVRELGTVIDRAALLGNGKKLEVAKALGATPIAVDEDDAQRELPTEEPDASVSEPQVSRTAAGATCDSTSLEAITRKHIEQMLRETYGRIEGPLGTARRLKINPHTLRYRMRKLGIDWKSFRPGTLEKT